MKRFFIVAAILFVRAMELYAASPEAVWKWDYTAEEDAFVDMTGGRKSGFLETNTPGVYGGRLVVELPEGMSFKQDGVPALLISGNDGGVAFRVEAAGRRAVLSLEDPSVGTAPVQALEVRLNPKAIRGKLGRGADAGCSVCFHRSGIPSVFRSPVTGRTYSLVFNDEFDDGEIDPLKWDTRSNVNPFTRRGVWQGAPYYVLCHDEWTKELDGELRLEVSKYPTQSNVVMTGGILSLGRFMTRYGYYETKVSFRECTGEGYWPAFWIHYDAADKYGEGTEIDVFEYIPRDDQIFQTLHWFERQAKTMEDNEIQHIALDYDANKLKDEHRSSTKYFTLEEARSREHTFAVEWTPDELIFYTDGQVTRRVSKKEHPEEVPSAYQMVYFSCSAGEWGGNVMNNEQAAYVYFDYCRCYQEKHQDAIYTVDGAARKISAEKRAGKL